MNKELAARRRRTALINAAALSLALATLGGSAAAQDLPPYLFSKAANPSPISQSLAGAGTAMPLGGFQALVNPALAAGMGKSGVFAAGYGRGQTFDNLVLPLGAVFNDGAGALGAFYRYLDGGQGRVHDAAVNLSGRMFEQVDAQGPVEFGVNIRYENSKWRHAPPPDTEQAASAITARSQSVLFDAGFYQPHVLPWLDFSAVLGNINGYRWADADGDGKSKGWVGWRYCTATIGALVSIPLSGGALLFQLPIDVEIANPFTGAAPTKYILRAGLDTRILEMFNLRFGYASAPENPLDMLKDFNRKNLFFGGVGVFVKPVQVDFFAGKDEFGVSAGYWY